MSNKLEEQYKKSNIKKWKVPYIYIIGIFQILLSNSVMTTKNYQTTFTPQDNNNGLIKRGRKKIPRKINYTPTLTVRQPTDGVKSEGTVILGHDELEALRLKSVNGLGVISAAAQMGISKSLFAKIYNEAITKVTNALIHGRSLHIQVRQADDFEETMRQKALI